MSSIKTKKRYLYHVSVVLFLLLFYFGTQFATSRIVGNDGHFHIQFSKQILNRGLVNRLPELRYTIWNDSYRDHHFLFHIVSIPFSLFPDIEIGAKAAAATFATLCALVFWWSLSQLKVKYCWLWLLLFICGSSVFLFRMQMPRAQSLAVMTLIIITIALIKKRSIVLFIFGFLNVWLYDSFLMLIIVALIWLFAERLTTQKWEHKSILALLSGLLAGCIINPFFPSNISSYIFQIKRSLAGSNSIPLPGEWLPQDGWTIILDNIPVILSGILMTIIVLTVIDNQSVANSQEKRSEHLFLTLISIFFSLLLFKARRFIEYLPPILLLLFATTHRNYYPIMSKKQRRTFITLASLVAFIGGSFIVVDFIRNNQPDKTHECYLEAGKWMDKHIPNNELIFPADWDDFPRLYMNAPRLRYVVGLDPLFMLKYDKELYNLYRDITRGQYPGLYAPIIKEAFGSNYIFTEIYHKNFIRAIESEPNVYRIFSKPQCRIYYIE